MLKEKTMCVGDLVDNRDFDVNCNFDVYDCTKPGTDWTDGVFHNRKWMGGTSG